MSTSGQPGEQTRRTLLAIVLLVGALLRLAHLDQGLRHTPHEDERYFVENAARMLATGSLDHGYYEYPGLLFYVLVPVLALARAGRPPGPEAYLAARVFLACCGVLALALAERFGRRLAGARAGLWAAAFLAVSPVHVETAHMLRADVLLDALMILVFLALLRLGEGRDGNLADARAGCTLGLAVGLKFSAALAGASYVAARLLTSGRRLRGLLLAAAAAALVFALVSPYALLKAPTFLAGVSTQISYHYQERPAATEPYTQRLAAYASVWPKALGWAGALLALVGLGLARRDWRRVLPLALLPPLTAAVFASTGYFFNRHMIPSLSVVAVLAGLALQALGGRWPRLALAAGLAALSLPLAASWRSVEAMGRPSTRDRAADWVAAHLPGPARVLTDVTLLRLPEQRYELLRPRFFDSGARLQAGESGLVVSLAEDEALFGDAPPLLVLEPASPFEGPRLLLRRPRSPVWRPLPLGQAELSASAGTGRLEALRDGQLETFWAVDARRGQPEWIVLAFGAPVRLGRAELMLGDRPRDAGRGLRLLASADGQAFEPVRTWPGRPPTREQLANLAGFSEVLLWEPRELRALRIVRQGGERRWSVAELELAAPLP